MSRYGRTGVLSMETLEAIFTRRSVRAFTPEPVPDELLCQVLRAGAASASGGNVQPWGFVLVQSPGRLAGLRALSPGIIGQPAAVIAICLDGERAVQIGGAGGERMAWLDIGLATQNLLLAAHSLGLGACPIGSFHRQGVAVFLNLPAGVRPVLLMALGYPEIKPTPPGRRPLSEVC
ncbi:MAG TPA: nitroreductase family protein, partial [Anaerolineae bacterium]|nr:nitroreductase family protein [Anaerolineae bacterium]